MASVLAPGPNHLRDEALLSALQWDFKYGMKLARKEWGKGAEVGGGGEEKGRHTSKTL